MICLVENVSDTTECYFVLKKFTSTLKCLTHSVASGCKVHCTIGWDQKCHHFTPTGVFLRTSGQEENYLLTKNSYMEENYCPKVWHFWSLIPTCYWLFINVISSWFLSWKQWQLKFQNKAIYKNGKSIILDLCMQNKLLWGIFTRSFEICMFEILKFFK